MPVSQYVQPYFLRCRDCGAVCGVLPDGGVLAEAPGRAAWDEVVCRVGSEHAVVAAGDEHGGDDVLRGNSITRERLGVRIWDQQELGVVVFSAGGDADD